MRTRRVTAVLSILGRRPGDQRLEVAGEPRPVAGEVDRLHPHPVVVADQTAQLSDELESAAG